MTSDGRGTREIGTICEGVGHSCMELLLEIVQQKAEERAVVELEGVNFYDTSSDFDCCSGRAMRAV